MKDVLHKLIDKFIIPNFDIEMYEINEFDRNLRHDVEIAIDIDYYVLHAMNSKTKERLYNETKMLMQMIGLTMVHHIDVMGAPSNLIKIRGAILK